MVATLLVTLFTLRPRAVIRPRFEPSSVSEKSRTKFAVRRTRVFDVLNRAQHLDHTHVAQLLRQRLLVSVPEPSPACVGFILTAAGLDWIC